MADQDLRHLKAGDTVVVVVPRDRGRPAIVIPGAKVAKVARIYFETAEDSDFYARGQFRRDDGLQKSGYMPSRAYATIEAYEHERRRLDMASKVSSLSGGPGFGTRLQKLTDDELATLLALLEKAHG